MAIGLAMTGVASAVATLAGILLLGGLGFPEVPATLTSSDLSKSNPVPTAHRIPARPARSERGHGSAASATTVEHDSAHCARIAKRIDWLTSRLRAGYGVAEGERWKQELRELRKEKRVRC